MDVMKEHMQRFGMMQMFGYDGDRLSTLATAKESGQMKTQQHVSLHLSTCRKLLDSAKTCILEVHSKTT